MRAFLAIALYAIALAAIYTATAIAPDMTWPVTAVEYQAASLLVLGVIAKLGGAFALLGIR